ncbi:MAG: glutamate--tRNA ligase [Acidimicrobiales bacterium]
MGTPRVRFAPSPTGYFHVGSARTALFNWLFARQQGGVFVLRIEDTDAERNREEWVDGIRSAMAWLGMEPDEGPFRQSERGERYQAAADALWEAGYLYACDCSREQVVARTRGNATPGYDGHCRERGLDRGSGALRFRTPTEGVTVVADVIRGEVSFPHEAMEDFVVVKSSGQPLFVLANVVDDRDMQITHVVRGEDLLPSTPKGILVWRALDAAGVGLGTALPVYAHLPMLVNEQRKKLSKRRDPVAVESYRDQGYLPEAFRNYLALLGWSPSGDREKVGLDVLVGEFRLEDVNHAPAFFDVRKLDHLNGEYLRDLAVDEFIARSRPWVVPGAEVAAGRWVPPGGSGPPWLPERYDQAVFARLAPLVQERVTRLDQVPTMVDFVFLAEPAVDTGSWGKAIGSDPGAAGILSAALGAYRACPWTADGVREATVAVGEAVGRKLAKAQAPVRVAVTGRTVGPPLFESLLVLGREEVLRRLASALERAGGTDAAAGGGGGAGVGGDHAGSGDGHQAPGDAAAAG